MMGANACLISGGKSLALIYLFFMKTFIGSQYTAPRLSYFQDYEYHSDIKLYETSAFPAASFPVIHSSTFGNNKAQPPRTARPI